MWRAPVSPGRPRIDVMSLKLVLLVGSVRSDRQGIKAARFVERSLIARGHDVTLVDPVEARLPLLDRMYKEYEREPRRKSWRV